MLEARTKPVFRFFQKSKSPAQHILGKLRIFNQNSIKFMYWNLQQWITSHRLMGDQTLHVRLRLKINKIKLWCHHACKLFAIGQKFQIEKNETNCGRRFIGGRSFNLWTNETRRKSKHVFSKDGCHTTGLMGVPMGQQCLTSRKFYIPNRFWQVCQSKYFVHVTYWRFNIAENEKTLLRRSLATFDANSLSKITWVRLSNR